MVNLVDESLKFMILGMGTVFLLLLFIVWLTKLQSFIVAKYFPDKKVTPVIEPNVSNGSDNNELVAVISAAIDKYKG